MIDKELFLRDTMPDIFRSNDIETLLINSFHALKRHMPLDMVDFSYYLEDKHTMLRLCTVEDGKVFKNRTLSLSERVEVGRYPDDVYTLTECYDFFSDSPKTCPTENNSCIIMQCKNVDRVIGFFSIKVRDGYVYGDTHKALMKELVTPYNGAFLYVLSRAHIIRLVGGGGISPPVSGADLSGIVGADGCLKNVVEQALKVAAYPSAVLLTGETGTGKEILANFIHSSSERKNEPFVKINCGAIPENLIETELFGYEKGAFTGADTQKKGCFELAHNGTLFLDEVGELSPAAQTKLLRAL